LLVSVHDAEETHLAQVGEFGVLGEAAIVLLRQKPAEKIIIKTAK
jgi:hypothetical protein